jgi:tetratricopeptide (TPR) repeat protein
MRSAVLNLLIFCAFVASVPEFAGAIPHRPGDKLYEKRNKENMAREALELYRKEAASQPQKVEALWRLSMACHFVGMRYAKDAREKEILFEEGIEMGQRAVDKDPKCAPCHFWTAINRSLYGQTVGMFKMLFSLKQILEHLEKTAELDPEYALAGSYRVRGIIYHKLPGILGGSDDQAEEFFEKAYSLSPNALNALFLVRFLEKEHGDEKKVQARVQKVAKEAIELVPELGLIEVAESREELRRFIRSSSLLPSSSTRPDSRK